MAVAASQAGDAESSRAPGLTSGLQGAVNVHSGTLLLVPQWRFISSIVFYMVFSDMTIYNDNLHISDISLTCDLVTELDLITDFDFITKLQKVSIEYLRRVRLVNSGHLPVPEMRIRSILLIKSDIKWCIHLNRSLLLYCNYLVSFTACEPVAPPGHM